MSLSGIEKFDPILNTIRDYTFIDVPCEFIRIGQREMWTCMGANKEYDFTKRKWKCFDWRAI